MIATNVKYLRNFSGLNQTAFGQLFKATRGMIDTYERGVAKPSVDFIRALAEHYNISVDVLMKKDLRLNPGLMYANASGIEVTANNADDLLRAKDEMIKELRQQIKYLQKQNDDLMKALAGKSS